MTGGWIEVGQEERRRGEGACGGMDREEEIKGRDIQRLAASSSTSLSFQQSLRTRASFFFFFFKRLRSRPVIDSSWPAACSEAKDFIINRTRFNLLLQAEWRCSLCCLFTNSERRTRAQHAAKNIPLDKPFDAFIFISCLAFSQRSKHFKAKLKFFVLLSM